MKRFVLGAFALASLAAMMIFGSALRALADEEDDLLPARSR